ncbi:MAG: hypothetical protein OXB84_06270 [Halobacteriovoraceae bacterium]|nr:hypothetical protein [Halobacteriovoraceae bacterium]
MGKKIRKEIINTLKNYVEEEHNGNFAKAAEKLEENKTYFFEILNSGKNCSLDKLIRILKKTKKYNVILKIVRQ